MGISSAISAIKTSIELVGKLREIAKNMEQAELKATIAALANQLADANLKMAELKEEMATIKEENQALKNRAENGKPTVKWGCYIFEGDERLYCPACFDTKGKKHLTTRVNSKKRQCSVCHTELFP